jgi:Bacterial protein of unknown function (DUF916)./Protein of unknown function C-terminal (DUF3324).
MGIMNKKHFFIIRVAIITLIFFWVTTAHFPVMAASNNGAGFYVRAKLPANQLDQKVSYFDLRMQPGQTQQLEVEITNEFSTPITITVEAISASTNRNGIIDYKTPDIQDKTLQIPFSSISVVEESSISISGNATKTAIITVTMPEETFDGVVLGGLVFTCKNEEKKQSQTTAINNIFSYVIGVKLSETDVEVLPQFEIDQITPEIINYQPIFTHIIRNTQAAIVKNMEIDISVTDSNGTVHANTSKSNIDMAPNSIMPFRVNYDNKQLNPGEYISDVQIKYNGQTFNQQMTFSVPDIEVEEINSEELPIPTLFKNLLDRNNWGISPYLTIILILNLVLTSILLIFLLKRNRKKDDNDEKA